MGRTGVTAADVGYAAEALRRRGDPVTARTVREEMGTGSYSTVGELLDEWMKLNPEPSTSAPVSQSLLPAHIADQLERVAVTIWNDMRETAERQFQAERDRYRQHVVELEAKCADAVAAATDVTVRNDGLQLELAETQEREAAAQAELTLERAALQQERAARQEATARADAQERHNGDLKTQLDQLHALLESEKQRHADAMGAAEARHAAALDQARHDAELRLSEVRDEMTRQLTAAGERAGGLETELQATRVAGEATATTLRQQLEQAGRERAEAQGALNALREQLARQTQVTAPAAAQAKTAGTGADAQVPEVRPRRRPPQKPPPRKTG